MNYKTHVIVCGMLLALAGCGGGGGGGSSVVPTPTPEPEPDPVTISGRVLDGPVSGGTLFAFSADGVSQALSDADEAEDRLANLNGADAITSVSLGESEDGAYSLTISGDQAGEAVFLVFDNTDAEDLTFGDTPFNMESVTVLGDAGSSQRVNVTPQSSMVAMQVRAGLPMDAAGISNGINSANTSVVAAVGTDETGVAQLAPGTDVITLDDEEALEDAATSLGAFVRGAAAVTGLERHEVLSTLALDAIDGDIDGSIPASAGADQTVMAWAASIDELQSLGEADGDEVSFGSCAATADFFRRACEVDVMDDYLEGIAHCQDGSADSLDDCAEEAGDDRLETLEECGEIFESRTSFCELADDEVHEPAFGAAFASNFVDPLEIGVSVTPNPYLPLVQGNRWVYEATSMEDGEEVTETVTVTLRPETKLIQGIQCLVVNDVVDEEGEVIEDTDDWFAQDVDGNVWYCGEIARNYEVFEGDMPELPELVDIEGSWKAGREGAKAGMLVPADPEPGDVIRTEILYGEAEDVIEIVGLDGDESTDAADCEDQCLVLREFTPLEPGHEESTYIKPGVGVILKLDVETGVREELISFSNDLDQP